MKRLALIGLTALALVGCAGYNGDLAAMNGSLSTAIVAVDGYYKLPLCGKESPGQLCQKITVSKQLKIYKDQAITAYLAAEKLGTPEALTAAQSALATLTIATPSGTAN